MGRAGNLTPCIAPVQRRAERRTRRTSMAMSGTLPPFGQPAGSGDRLIVPHNHQDQALPPTPS